MSVKPNPKQTQTLLWVVALCAMAAAPTHADEKQATGEERAAAEKRAEFEQAFASGDTKALLKAFKGVGRLDQKGMEYVFPKSFDHKDVRVRRRCAELALGLACYYGSDPLFDCAEALAADSDPETRHTIFATIIGVRLDEKIRPRLRAFLDKALEDPKVQGHAVLAVPTAFGEEGLERIRPFLRHENGDTRNRAILALLELAPKGALEGWRDVFAHTPDPLVRAEAVKKLWDLHKGAAAPAAALAATDLDWRVRRAAFKFVPYRAGTIPRALFDVGKADFDPRVRAAALSAAGRAAPIAILRDLAPAAEAKARKAGLTGAAIRDAVLRGILAEVEKRSDDWSWFGQAMHFQDMSPGSFEKPQAAEVKALLERHDSPRWRVLVAQAMLRFAHMKEARPIVADLLDAKEWEVRVMALLTLAEGGRRQASSVAVAFARTKVGDDAKAAGEAKVTAAMNESFISDLSHADPWQRAGAVCMLGQRVGKDGRALLGKALAAKDPRVRALAVLLADELHGPSAIALYTQALADPDRDVRLAVVQALGNVRTVASRQTLEGHKASEKDKEVVALIARIHASHAVRPR